MNPLISIEVSVEQHAVVYTWLNDLSYGLMEDWLAYRGLAGIISHEEAVSEAPVKCSVKGK